ncbi:MAG: ADP/ATP-dependent (S)-NAD(P)H-hydrate dehydratase, partial [Pseudomonadota bacterium]
LVCPRAALAENATQLTSIMVQTVERPAALSGVLRDRRLNAVCIGPGYGTGPAVKEAVSTILRARRGSVLDADALTGFADAPEALFARLHGECVLTPHDGEFSRLFGRPPPGGTERERAVQEAARQAGCTVLLKGPDTILADPSGAVTVISARGDAAAPWLATAGSGDVLAGLICGLLARGFSPGQAAQTGAYLHGCAGRHLGAGLISEDLPEALPAVFAELGV